MAQLGRCGGSRAAHLGNGQTCSSTVHVEEDGLDHVAHDLAQLEELGRDELRRLLTFKDVGCELCGGIQRPRSREEGVVPRGQVSVSECHDETQGMDLM